MGHGILHKRGWAAALCGAVLLLFFCAPPAPAASTPVVDPKTGAMVVESVTSPAPPLGPVQTTGTMVTLPPAPNPLESPVWIEVNTEPTPLDWANFLQSIGSWSTLNRLGLAALVTQGLLLLLRSKFGDLTGKAKLALVSVCSLSCGILALRLGGLDWGQALMHSTTLTALQVYGHQLAQTYLPPKGPGL